MTNNTTVGDTCTQKVRLSLGYTSDNCDLMPTAPCAHVGTSFSLLAANPLNRRWGVEPSNPLTCMYPGVTSRVRERLPEPVLLNKRGFIVCPSCMQGVRWLVASSVQPIACDHSIFAEPRRFVKIHLTCVFKMRGTRRELRVESRGGRSAMANTGGWGRAVGQACSRVWAGARGGRRGTYLALLVPTRAILLPQRACPWFSVIPFDGIYACWARSAPTCPSAHRALLRSAPSAWAKHVCAWRMCSIAFAMSPSALQALLRFMHAVACPLMSPRCSTGFPRMRKIAD
jgi:hypothetical protein